jgi:hypothetical protein
MELKIEMSLPNDTWLTDVKNASASQEVLGLIVSPPIMPTTGGLNSTIKYCLIRDRTYRDADMAF